TLVNRTFFKFLTGQCVDSLLLGVMLFIAFSLFGIPYASVVAVTTAVFSFIPYVGAFLACAVSILLILMVNPVKALVGLIVFLTVQFCEGQFLYPRVVGNSVGLSPLWTLVAALVGGELLGILGMIFFIPVGAVIYHLLRERADAALKKKAATQPE
ncbi:MAG: AI-2E family transporter, partial [Clostridia bacterium]|nr:AI-2E family transporter [Clostridia bacterium]